MRSVALEALRDHNGPGQDGGVAEAAVFLKEAQACEQQGRPSVGLGRDLHFRSSQVVGSALVVEGTPVHCALFPAPRSAHAGPMAERHRRRGFRRGHLGGRGEAERGP